MCTNGVLNAIYDTSTMTTAHSNKKKWREKNRRKKKETTMYTHSTTACFNKFKQKWEKCQHISRPSRPASRPASRPNVKCIYAELYEKAKVPIAEPTIEIVARISRTSLRMSEKVNNILTQSIHMAKKWSNNFMHLIIWFDVVVFILYYGQMAQVRSVSAHYTDWKQYVIINRNK